MTLEFPDNIKELAEKIEYFFILTEKVPEQYVEYAQEMIKNGMISTRNFRAILNQSFMMQNRDEKTFFYHVVHKFLESNPSCKEEFEQEPILSYLLNDFDPEKYQQPHFSATIDADNIEEFTSFYNDHPEDMKNPEIISKILRDTVQRGSINIYKFLVINNVMDIIDRELVDFSDAVKGGNKEIIHDFEKYFPITADAFDQVYFLHNIQFIDYLHEKYNFKYDPTLALKYYDIKLFISQFSSIEKPTNEELLKYISVSVYTGIKSILEFFLKKLSPVANTIPNLHKTYSDLVTMAQSEQNLEMIDSLMTFSKTIRFPAKILPNLTAAMYIGKEIFLGCLKYYNRNDKLDGKSDFKGFWSQVYSILDKECFDAYIAKGLCTDKELQEIRSSGVI